MIRGKEILKLSNLMIGYRERKADNVLMSGIEASASTGEMVALVGPNGVGKSTLLRTILGLHNSLGGEISLYSTLISEYSRKELATKAGFVYAGSAAIQNMTVYELVSLGRFPHTNWIGHLSKNDRVLVESSINSVGLSDFCYRNISELSDGERQRAMIARTLAQDTNLILLDEPTAFLDLPNKYELINLLKRLIREKGKTVVFSTHDLHIAIREADKIWLALETGLEQGAPEDLILKGTFKKIFKGTPLEFSEEEETFVYPFLVGKKINLKADGRLKYWTEKALKRIGIQVLDDENLAVLSVSNTETEEIEWRYSFGNIKKKFHSIYDMVTFIRLTDNN